MKTLLVAVDLFSGSTRVCDAACAIAGSENVRLVLLHVVSRQGVALRAFGFAAGEVRSMMAALQKREARRLLALARRGEKRGADVHAVIQTGEPAPTILAKAKSLRADLIVLGSHGHTAGYDLLVGSTAQRVLKGAEVPVLVVPQRAPRRG